MNNKIKEIFKLNSNLLEGKIYYLNHQKYQYKKKILRKYNLNKKTNSQLQTKEAYEYLWKNIPRNKKEVKKHEMKFINQYYPNRIKRILPLIKNSSNILNVACGDGLNAYYFFGKKLKSCSYFGVDIGSSPVNSAYKNFKNEKDLDINLLQDDLNSLPFKKNFFDVIYAPTTLMHTNSVENSMACLLKHLKKGGLFICWLYNKQPPIRQFTDQWIKNYLSNFSDKEAFKKLEPLTQLGFNLGKIKDKISVKKEINFLGIPKGNWTVQMFFYYYVFKCFYKKNILFKEAQIQNFDWYRPKNAHCHSRNEIKSFCLKNKIKPIFLSETPSAISFFAKKTS